MNSAWQTGNYQSRNPSSAQFTPILIKEDSTTLNVNSINAKTENSDRSIEDLRYEYMMNKRGIDCSHLFKYVNPANQITPQRTPYTTSNLSNEVMMFDGARANSGYSQPSSNLYSSSTSQNAFRTTTGYNGAGNQSFLGGTTGNQTAFGRTTGSQLGFGGNTGNQPGFGISTGNQPGFGVSTGNQSGFGVSTGNQPGFGVTTGNQPGIGGPINNQPGFGVTTSQNNPFSQSSGFTASSFGVGVGNPINTSQFNGAASNPASNSQITNPFTQSNASFGQSFNNPSQAAFGKYSQDTGYFNSVPPSQMYSSNQPISFSAPNSTQNSFGVPNTSQPMNFFTQASQNQNLPTHTSQNPFSQSTSTNQGQSNPFFQSSSNSFIQNPANTFGQNPFSQAASSNLYPQSNPTSLNQNLNLHNQGASNFFLQNSQPNPTNFGYPTGQNLNHFYNANSNNFMSAGNQGQNNYLKSGLNGFLPENPGFGQNFNQGTFTNIEKNLFAKEYMYNAYKDPHGLSWVYFDFDSLKTSTKPVEKAIMRSPEPQHRGNIETIIKNSHNAMPRGNLKDPFKSNSVSYNYRKRNINIPYEADRRLKHSFILKNKFKNTNTSMQNSDEVDDHEEIESNYDENKEIKIFISAPIFCERKLDYIMPVSATIRQVAERVCTSLSINNPFKLKFQGVDLPYDESLGSLNIPNECLLEMSDLRMISNEFLPRTKIYKFSPSIDEMKNMTINQLKNLSNFSIENEFGKMVFDGETNVTNLDVDDLVLIEKNCIIGYPNCSEEQKALIDNRLDKSAVVTLYNLKSQSGNTGKMAIKLMMNCEKNGTKFINYDENTGNFTFRIEKL
ncbi:hypothetical protein SteCoe_346 [Stentor coeruleus]|uniref:Peptidase S59 domain-containing protein n=1 Tax=Stentor coeruleus TaxID=5963 RepID=A0A1R2D4H3_9CILI|nr:hypothetical protein SteCoe_346 [Stentor coeruleus]